MIKRNVRLKVDNFLNGEDATPSKKTPWDLYTANLVVASLHLLQFLITFFLDIFYFKANNAPYLAGNQNLMFTSQAIIKSTNKDTSTICNQRNNPTLTVIEDYTNEASVIDTKLYDFGNTIVYQYTETRTINTPQMIYFFFLLSAVFQFINGLLLQSDSKKPRLMHYLEYSITGSLCIVTMAVNMGVKEITSITSIFGLFFGVNMFGACAELLAYAAETIPDELNENVNFLSFFNKKNLWYIPTIAAWVIFGFAIGPVLAQYRNTFVCSERKPPEYIMAAIVLQAVSFFAYGVVHLVGMILRSQSMRYDLNIKTIRAMDICMISLSFLSKTFLAWLLLAPAISFENQN
jgi:hypothetical protein